MYTPLLAYIEVGSKGLKGTLRDGDELLMAELKGDGRAASRLAGDRTSIVDLRLITDGASAVPNLTQTSGRGVSPRPGALLI